MRSILGTGLKSAVAVAVAAALVFGGAPQAMADTMPAAAADASAPATFFTAAGATAVAARSFYVTASSPYSNILSLQYLLNAYGFGTSGTGRYDAGTTASVKRFQAAKGLTRDGLAGPVTMKAMLGGSNVAVEAGWPNLNTVTAAQRQLVKIGWKLPVDGKWSAADTAAVKYVQTKYKIAATGTVDYVTWSYLFNPPGSSTPKPPTSGLRRGPVVLLAQYGTGLRTEATDCGPTALVVAQLRLGRTPRRWTSVANRGAAIYYARHTVLRMTNDSLGTKQIHDYRGVAAGFQRLPPGINARTGTVADATAAMRSGGVAMIVGRLSVARTWQGARSNTGAYHWITLTDYSASTGKYQVTDSSHRANHLVWVTAGQLATFTRGYDHTVYVK